ncbi:MAG: prepilin-type N-terminal cleavage/methylation domain-containing protein [Candidatus Jettenia sp.]|uniref:Prepilin-type N-terminal cleavage/methylation domain-containing protein n=1 Tax=Candidatus Jettenia caeni TaxID=247490 RepID=I3IMW0_9BACT|nr:prepilin-type N-terminal cleavage/methylation domain-containing protein [Candidatus Jettenia sp. AMX1]MBC6928692.1 prepilin-type N-terminal cleavage/methylation domain-containing protein [Candidatus Jettenia sp.]NUN24133.1 prepilin-type N-terminal cleavage/methylation domain-containing protein [Candidatus Jettenia caeni]KAA0250670.1 MAG: prepilin-type N-terminal cleavage/methylation domain-containing protein [Candidatus Jettenia sp. AMX1]MCE7880004.1 prepilin-type N-terminal cleavage/methyla
MFPRSKNKEQKEQGFTLIEILVAIFVLVIGIFGVMALFPVGIHKTSKIAKTTLGAVSAEVPLAYASYKYPENSGSPDYHIQDIVNLISGTDIPACYFYPGTGVIAIPGNSLYGWNTAIVPVDMSTPGNGTATSIAETYLFRQQTAVYKNYTTNNGTATFTYNSAIVSNVSNINTISVNHFIGNIQNRIWYRVVAVNELAGSITIGYPYEYETTSAAYISTNTIVGLYNTMLTSH